MGGSRIVNVELARLTVGVNRRRVIILAVFQVGSGGNLVGSVENALGRCGGLDDDHFNTVGGGGRRTEAAVNSIPLQEIIHPTALAFLGGQQQGRIGHIVSRIIFGNIGKPQIGLIELIICFGTYQAQEIVHIGGEENLSGGFYTQTGAKTA